MIVQTLIENKNRAVVYVTPDQMVSQVLAALEFEDVGALAVSKNGKKIVGIISERDVVRALRYYGVEIFDRTVSDLMTSKVVTCEPDEAISEISARMELHSIRHLPVIENGQLAGMISLRDVLSSQQSSPQAPQAGNSRPPFEHRAG